MAGQTFHILLLGAADLGAVQDVIQFCPDCIRGGQKNRHTETPNRIDPEKTSQNRVVQKPTKPNQNIVDLVSVYSLT